LPVTVKTRLGWDDNSINIDEVAERLQDIGVAALSIHARTRAQLYKGHSDWSHIARVKNNPRITMPIFGNGDIDSPQKAKLFRERYGVDGIMIGRASIGYPWIFREVKHYFKTGELLPPPTLEERVEAARKHLLHSISWKGESLGIVEMRRHYTNYFRGIPNIKEYRKELVTLREKEAILEVLQRIENDYSGFEFEHFYGVSEKDSGDYWDAEKYNITNKGIEIFDAFVCYDLLVNHKRFSDLLVFSFYMDKINAIRKILAVNLYLFMC
jgi:tRNA-dihydrouridine synthase B